MMFLVTLVIFQSKPGSVLNFDPAGNDGNFSPEVFVSSSIRCFEPEFQNKKERARPGAVFRALAENRESSEQVPGLRRL